MNEHFQVIVSLCCLQRHALVVKPFSNKMWYALSSLWELGGERGAHLQIASNRMAVSRQTKSYPGSDLFFQTWHTLDASPKLSGESPCFTITEAEEETYSSWKVHIVIMVRQEFGEYGSSERCTCTMTASRSGWVWGNLKSCWREWYSQKSEATSGSRWLYEKSGNLSGGGWLA